MLHRASLLAAPFLLAGVAGAQTPGFHLVGFPQGGDGSGVTALSRDGAVAVGWTSFNGSKAFRWTWAGGREDFGLEPGMPPFSAAYAVDSAGLSIVGRAAMGPEPLPSDRAFRRVGNQPLLNLGLLPNRTRSQATGISGDGVTVVGWSESTQFTEAYGEAFRWTESGGMQGLGYLRPNGTFSKANAISRDGTTIVGLSQSDDILGDVEAFRWTQAGGMQALPGLAGGGLSDWDRAMAVNADGSVVVGKADVPGTTNSRAVRWVNGLVQDLGIIPGYARSLAYAVDDSGDVVGGATSTGQPTAAFVWTSGAGMMLLSGYLDSHGIEVPAGYRLEEVRAISGDGLTFGGFARHLTTNDREGFVATIPSPGTAVVILLAPALLGRRRTA